MAGFHNNIAIGASLLIINAVEVVLGIPAQLKHHIMLCNFFQTVHIRIYLSIAISVVIARNSGYLIIEQIICSYKI